MFPFSKQLRSNSKIKTLQQRVLRLKVFTLVFLVLLLAPLSVGVYLGYQTYQSSLLAEYRQQGEILHRVINKKLYRRLISSNTLPTNSFDHVILSYDPSTQQTSSMLSPLADSNHDPGIHGFIGYFQYDLFGQFNSPIWHDALNSEVLSKKISNSSIHPQQQQAIDVYHITSQSQALLMLIEKIKHSAEKQGSQNSAPKSKLLFRLIDDVPEYFIFYRIVEFNQQQRIQGYVVNRLEHLSENINYVLNLNLFPDSVLLDLKDTTAGNHHLFYYDLETERLLTPTTTQLDILFPTKDEVTPIFEKQMDWPFKNYQLAYSISSLPITSAMIYGLVLLCILLLVVLGGCWGFYRVGVKQLKLAEQRLNFVSSVSHELKTPLTSIRMYSEMLKSGTLVSASHQHDYYEFIFNESERLSRLIENILQLTKLNQPHAAVKPEFVKLTVLMDMMRSKVSSLMLNNEFELNIKHEFDQPEAINVWVDNDAFAQVIINIADNAVKFFDKASIQDLSRQRIDVCFKPDAHNSEQLLLTIRDYGPGITAEQQNKIFDLFYRGGSELTRSTQGTGIGLALVNELVIAQQGSIKVTREKPGLTMNIQLNCQYHAD